MNHQEIVADSAFQIQVEVFRGVTAQQIRETGAAGFVGAGGAAWQIPEKR